MSALALLARLDASTLAALPGLSLCHLARACYYGARKEEAGLIERAIRAKRNSDPGPEQTLVPALYLASASTGLDIFEAWPAIDALIKAANGRLRARVLDEDCVLSIIKCAKEERFDHSGIERVGKSYRYPISSAGCIAGRRARQRCLYIGMAQASGWRKVAPWEAWEGLDFFEDPTTDVERQHNEACISEWTRAHDAVPYNNVIRIKQLRRRI